MLSGVIFWRFGVSLETLFLWALIPIFLAITVIDWRLYIIPNVLNFIIGIFGVGYLVLAHALELPEAVLITKHALISGLVYFAFSYSLAFVFYKVRGKEALGGGDIKFFGAAGIWLGLGFLPYFLMLSGGFGVLCAIYAKLTRGGESFPFGPALIGAFIVGVLTHGIFKTGLL